MLATAGDTHLVVRISTSGSSTTSAKAFNKKHNVDLTKDLKAMGKLKREG